MTKCFAYCRVSSKGQVSGDGFPRQRAAIDAYAKEHGLKIERYFEEEGVSGKTDWDDRPAWVEMIAALNGTKTIVIERLDRLARDLGVQEHVIRDLQNRKINLVSTAEPDLGSSDPTRILFRQIVGSVAQYERSMLVAKMKAAKDRIRKRDGRCEGRIAYGHDPSKPEQAEVLAYIMQLRGEGYSFNEIAIRLNSKNISTRESGKWHGVSISRLVKREEAS